MEEVISEVPAPLAAPAPVRALVGRLTLTIAVQIALDDSTLDEDFLGECLERHARGDWGDLCAEDQQANADALRTGARVLSSYHLPQPIDRDDRLWIISEGGFITAGRERFYALTTILFPSDY